MRCFLNLKVNMGTPIGKKLVRGSAPKLPYRLYKLKQSGITQIIDLRNSAYISSYIERLFCKLIGIKYNNFKYPYRLNHLPEHDFFQKINDTIENNVGITYMHCEKGKRRTGICAAVYEKECLKRSKEDIISELINFGYMELKQKQNSHKWKKLNSIYSDFIRKYYPE